MDDLDLDNEILDYAYPVRVPTDDPMWMPDKIDHAVMGSFWHKLTQPVRSVANVVAHSVALPAQITERALMTPGRLSASLANRILPGGGGGGGGGAPAPAPDQAPPMDPTTMDPGDGGGDPSMSAGTWMHPSRHNMFRGHAGHHGHFRHPAAAMGFGLPDWHPLAFLERHNPFASSAPAGDLLVSAVPGGVAAKEAHAIASKALKSGALKPEHLKKAGSLARAARSGHKGSLKKIAGIKQAAGRGDPNAEVALDRLRLADSIQQGGTVEQSTTSLRHLRQLGLATLKA